MAVVSRGVLTVLGVEGFKSCVISAADGSSTRALDCVAGPARLQEVRRGEGRGLERWTYVGSPPRREARRARRGGLGRVG
jgi:hypothetical protein